MFNHLNGIPTAQSTIGRGGVSSTEMAKLALPSDSRPMETSNENSGDSTINIYLTHFMNGLGELSLAEYVLKLAQGTVIPMSLRGLKLK